VSTGRDLSKISLLSFVYQAGAVYFINQIFLTFIFGFNDKINLDVHPFAGAIGLDAYDVYPLLSAFVMAFHKYGIFLLFSLWCFQVSQLNLIEDSKVPLYYMGKGLYYWLSDHLTTCLLLIFTFSNLGLYLMLSIMTSLHSHERASAFTLLSGSIGTCYSILHLIQTIKERKNKLPKGRET